MIKKQISVETIIEFLGKKVITVHGQTERLFVDNLADVDRVCETTLDWINPSKTNKQQMVEWSKARVLLTDSSIVPVDGKTLIVVGFGRGGKLFLCGKGYTKHSSYSYRR